MIVLRKELIDTLVQFKYRYDHDNSVFVFNRYPKNQNDIHLYLYALDNPDKFSQARAKMTKETGYNILKYKRILLRVDHFVNNKEIQYI